MDQQHISKTIGLIITYTSGYIFPLIISGAESYLRNSGYRLMLVTTQNDKRKEREALEMMLESGVSGLMIEPSKMARDNPNASLFAELSNRQIPYVMINEGYEGLAAPCLITDDEQAGFIATEHLIKLGHREIAGFFKIDDTQGVNRMKGFIRAHNKYHIPISTNLIEQFTLEDPRRPVKAAFTYLQSLQRPSAFVVYNDLVALHMLEVTRQMGVEIPGDLSVVSFDDSDLAVATEVKLTTVSHPKELLGEQAAKLVIDLVEQRRAMRKENIIVTVPKLVIRNSTAKLKS